MPERNTAFPRRAYTSAPRKGLQVIVLLKRLRRDWTVLLGVFFGMLLATSLVAAAPVYLRALDRLAFSVALDRLESPYLNINVFATSVPLDHESLDEAGRAIADASETHMRGAVSSSVQYFKSPLYLAWSPSRPLSRGYFQHLAGLEEHSTFVLGRPAGEDIVQGPAGPEVEAVVSTQTAFEFELKIGDLVSYAPSPATPIRVFARIVGIIEPDDAGAEYWRLPRIFLDPAPPLEDPERGLVVDRGKPLAIFVDREVLIDTVSSSFRGSLVDPFWFLMAEHDSIKDWPVVELGQRLADFREQVGRDLPGASVPIGVMNQLVDDLRIRSFFSRLPVLLSITTIVATVLVYLSISFSFVVRRRQREFTLFKARGAQSPRLLSFYGPEAVGLTLAASVLGVALALGAVALAGRLPSFRDITGGGNLPVELSPAPFVAAAVAGLALLALLLAYTWASTRGGPVAGRLWSSRPPGTSLFHRYYMDFGLVVIGGLIFWELQARGRVVSGGLFKDVQVNEALLAAPVLLLVVVSLMFVRLFPMVVRFAGGESPTLLHLFAAATIPAAAAVTMTADVPVSEWAPPLALILVVGAVYWATTLARRASWVANGEVIQLVATGGYFVLRPPDPEGAQIVAVIAFMALVPAQLVFRSLAAARRITPVWLVLVLWRMARDPLRYTWLIMLLILATGLATSSTTIGATLDKGQEDSLHYELATDIRLSEPDPGADSDATIESLAELPGLTLVSPALRERARVDNTDVSLLAVDSGTFSRIAWYRDDLADRSMFQLMSAVRPVEPADRVPIPFGAATIGAWVRPAFSSTGLALWFLVEDATGVTHTIDLGTIERLDWARLSVELPAGLKAPLYLSAIEVFEPADNQGNLSEFADLVDGTPGHIYLDDLHVTLAGSGEERVFENFEDTVGWSPIVTDPKDPDEIVASEKEVHGGQRSALFTFGSIRNRLIRGFQRSPSGGPVPVVVSNTFAELTGLAAGQTFMVEVADRLVTFRVSDTAEYFPTLSPDGTGFVVVDLDSLLGHLDLLTYLSPPLRPNELFLASAAGAADEVLSAARALVGSAWQTSGYESELSQLRLDPLGGAGWRVLVWVSIAVAIIAGGLGYGTYLLSSGANGHQETGVLRSAGFTGWQLGWLLGVEHLAVAAVGLGIGTWTGLQMSALMASSVAVTAEGLPIVPPIVTVTNWQILIPFYVILIAAVTGALLLLHRPGAEHRNRSAEG